MKLSIATAALLAQSALCEVAMQAREAKVTAAASLARRAQKDKCNDGKTACGDGNGCCPRGSKCTSSKGVGMCANACYNATLFCDFGRGVKLCCQPGASCDYSQSVCTQHKTDAGGVWTSPTTSSTANGTPLPTAPVFTSTSGEEDSMSSTKTTSGSSSSATKETQSSQSSTETGKESGATDKSGTDGGATPTKKPEDSGSATVASWSAGVLAAVFGIMVAL